MRKIRLVSIPSAVLLLACLASVPGKSQAQSLDLELWRLGNPDYITLHDGTVVPDPSGDPEANQRLMADANLRFRMLMVDLGLAIHPAPAHPANSPGRAGAAFEIGLRMPQIHPQAAVMSDECPPGNPNCRIWVTRGTTPGRPNQQRVPNRLILPSLQVRKGLPFSFELNSQVQYLVGSSSCVMSGGARWALNEGFDFLPDLSIGAQATRLVGTRDFGLTTASADIIVGKWFAIAGSATISPYIGWQRVWVSSFSSVIDFDPSHERMNDPTRDDTIFDDVPMAENIYDRVVFGLRLRSYIGQFLIAGTYTPMVLDMDPTLSLVFQAGMEF